MPNKTETEETVDTTVVDRVEEKEQLLEQICFFKDQKAALDKCIRARQERLQLLMAEDGDRKLKTGVGQASFYTQTVYSIHSTTKMAHLFTKQALVGICRPNKAFVEAAKKVGVEFKQAITEGVDERFKVERSRTKDSREAQKRLIEETQEKFEAKLAEFIAAMED